MNRTPHWRPDAVLTATRRFLPGWPRLAAAPTATTAHGARSPPQSCTGSRSASTPRKAWTRAAEAAARRPCRTRSSSCRLHVSFRQNGPVHRRSNGCPPKRMPPKTLQVIAMEPIRHARTCSDCDHTFKQQRLDVVQHGRPLLEHLPHHASCMQLRAGQEVR